MKNPVIIVTMDYELPGNGFGDPLKMMVEPTRRLLKILSLKNIKMTVFFEIEEFITFQKYSKELEKFYRYDPKQLIENQLSDMIKMGHEIALHIHPQWIGSTFKNNQFNLYENFRCLFDVFKTEQEMTQYIVERTRNLDRLVKKYDASKKISCFRAGGLALRPEKLILNALSVAGIKADSSVIKGLYRKSKAVNIDYRNSPIKPAAWKVGENVCKPDVNGKIWELPIFSKMMPEFKKLKLNRIVKKFFSTGLPKVSLIQGIEEMAIPRTPWGALSHFFKKVPIKYDYCHMTCKEMLSYIENSGRDGRKECVRPMVMIGHSKEFFNDSHFKKFLETVTNRNLAQFRTLQEVVELLECQDQ